MLALCRAGVSAAVGREPSSLGGSRNSILIWDDGRAAGSLVAGESGRLRGPASTAFDLKLEVFPSS